MNLREKKRNEYLEYRAKDIKPTKMTKQDAKKLLNTIDTLLIELDQSYFKFDDIRRMDFQEGIEKIKDTLTENDNFKLTMNELLDGEEYHFTPLEIDKAE